MNPYYPFGLNPSQPPLVRGGVRFALPLRFAPLFSYSCSGIFATPAKLIQPFTVVFQDKCFGAMASGEVTQGICQMLRRLCARYADYP